MTISLKPDNKNILKSRLKIRFLASPHQRDRRGRAVDMIVIHHISCPPGHFDTADVVALFLGTLDTAKHPAYREVEGKELSAHFLVDRRGEDHPVRRDRPGRLPRRGEPLARA